MERWLDVVDESSFGSLFVVKISVGDLVGRRIRFMSVELIELANSELCCRDNGIDVD